MPGLVFVRRAFENQPGFIPKSENVRRLSSVKGSGRSIRKTALFFHPNKFCKMKKEQLLPIAKVVDLEKLENLRYLPGFPRAYRFDAKKGILRFKNEMDLTGKGQSFSFVPIAHRIFSCDLFSGESIARG